MGFKSWIRKKLDYYIPGRDWELFGKTIRGIGEICAFILLGYHLFPEFKQSDFYKSKTFYFSLFTFFIFVGALVINLYAHQKQKRYWGDEKKKLQRDARFSKVLGKINRGFRDTHKVLGDEIDEKIKILQQFQNSIHGLKISLQGDCSAEGHKEAKKSAEELSKISPSKMDKHKQKVYVSALGKFCNDISEVFSSITRTYDTPSDLSCGVCIKFLTLAPTSDPEEQKVYTLIRDRNTENRYGEHDTKDKQFTFKKNTAFLSVWHNISKANKKKHYFSNSLIRDFDDGYKNESFYGKKPDFKELKKMSLDERRNKWPLDYRSSIVAPIYSAIELDGKTTNRILGFLCLDANHEDVFIEESDADLLAGCAEGIFNVLNEFWTQMDLNK